MATFGESRRPVRAQRIADFGPTVFAVWTRLAQEHNAINLGQGFPDFAPPPFALEAAQEALTGYQQYSPLAGVPALRQALARQTEREWGRPVDPDQEITVTVGATEGIYTSIQAVVNPGDEVILLEPFYDSYPASVTMAGGVCRYVPVTPTKDGGWALDFDDLRKAITDKTRLLVLNNPQNPTGKCYTREELQQIADLCIEHDLLVLADEVYDHLVYEGATHIPIATLDGMWDRTITLSSVGKTFSVTGWKIGWAIAGAELSEAIRMAHQWIPFCVATPLQFATAAMLDQCEKNGYYDDLVQLYQRKRDSFLDVLRASGLRPITPQGTYFIMADTSEWGFANDREFCQHLTTEVGVAAIPPSPFYSDPHKHLANHLIRFAFCKKDDVLEAAAERLKQYAAKRG